MSEARELPLIAVDIGNGAAKWGVLVDWRTALGDPQRIGKCSTSDLGSVSWAPELPAERCQWAVVSVHRQAEGRLAAWVARERPGDRYHALGGGDLPLAVKLERPERVGMDRLAAAVGVNSQREAQRPAIVVDSGTAMTIDLVSAAGEFLGGAILPGVGMSARSLAEQTDALPLVDASWRQTPPPAVGRSTIEAIQSGLFWGAVGAINELADQMAAGWERSGPAPQLFLTGGDSPLLAPWLRRPSIAAPHLVLFGAALAMRNRDR